MEYDLPFFNPHSSLPNYDTLSSSAQAAQAAQQASYSTPPYSAPPPPPQSAASRQPPIINTHHSISTQESQPASARNPRLSHFFDGDQQLGHQYLSTGQVNLSRSASLGNVIGSSNAAGLGSGAFSSRRNRNHMPSDLESAYLDDSMQTNLNERHQPHRSLGTTQQMSQSFYPPSVTYATSQQAQLTGHSTNSSLGSTTTSDPYQQESQYSNTPGQARRHTTTAKMEDAPASARSPRRGQTGQGTTPLLDPYSQLQQMSSQSPGNAYSPTSAVYQQYSSPPELSAASPYQPPQQQASVKPEARSPPLGSPFAGQRTLPPPPAQTSSQYHYPMDTTSPGPSQSSQGAGQHQYASQSSMPLRQTVSTPNTPLSYQHAQQLGQAQYHTMPQEDSMAIETSVHKRRASGFKRVRDSRDLKPYVNNQPAGRRQDANGQYLSPLRQLTTHITDTYHICNPQFHYESASNPRRVLTKPSKPVHNDGFDNEDYDYILYVNDCLGSDQNKYLILDVLGQGTFGQVVKCQNMKTHEIVAVKVVKNKPAYFNQSMMEVTILELLNGQCDPHDEHHILRLRDSFIHKNHLCLVFELLSSNLYELIKQNQFQGLSTQLVKVFTAQLLDALSILKDARLIHCDLKPENILLKSLQSPTIKVIDFGSACHERQTVYTYIQSRFYRSPEVLLGIPYSAAIDMWSLGCIAVELFLGLPLFPGTSEYNQITRIVEMLGLPPSYMLDMGKQSGHFFDQYMDHFGQKKYKLKSIEQYSRERNTQEQPGKQYFKATTLPDIINSAPMPSFKSSSKSGHEVEKELMNRAAFIDFCQGLLNLDPLQRWTPQQARMHPFITGEKYTKPFVPPSHSVNASSTSSTSSQSSTPQADPKRPYGGLVPQQPKGQRAYQDAATYNQHLNQHQAYTAQQQAASQQATAYRNPYVTQQSQQQMQTSGQTHRPQESQHFNPPSQQVQHSTVAHGALGHQSSSMNLAASAQPNPPSSTYFPNSRARANTINNMDAIPPALARLQHMNHDVISGRNALTPVLNRDDAMREWERRQAGKAAAQHQPYQPLEYLQQQAELAAASGYANWNQARGTHRFQAPPSSLSQSYQPASLIDDSSDRREVVMSSVRNAARSDQQPSLYGSSTANLSSPPQAYVANSNTGNPRYASSYPQQQTQQQGQTPFDGLDRGRDIATMYVPMQPDQYQSTSAYGQSSQASPEQRAAGISGAQSFYNAGVVASGGVPGSAQRNPFVGAGQTSPPSIAQRDGQRAANGMDIWPR
ncbi:kinase [Pyrrhoderma noxium]|uniref:Kinase n=1 Tax=Pyrrhoderma noxium TaxID=2282107 RepID=A0A286UGQ0_9AGAM|nr:kinase [Pyrrhoderma noxium]